MGSVHPTCTRNVCEFGTTLIPVPELCVIVISVGYTQNHTRGIHPGYYPTKNHCNFCGTLIHAPGTSGSSVRRCHKDPAYGYSMFTHIRNFSKFCSPVPQYPEVLKVLQDVHTRARNFCEFCKTRATTPGVRVQHFLYPLGTSVSSVCPCHNTRNFWKFCNTSIPVPETSGSSVRSPHAYRESANPTELERGRFRRTSPLQAV